MSLNRHLKNSLNPQSCTMRVRCGFRPIGCVRCIFVLMCFGTVHYIWILDNWNEEMEKKIAYGRSHWISKRFKGIIMLHCATRSTSSLKKTVNCESGNMWNLCLCKKTPNLKRISQPSLFLWPILIVLGIGTNIIESQCASFALEWFVKYGFWEKVCY